MKSSQRGASTLDLLITFGFATALLLLLLPATYDTFKYTVKAQSLKNGVAQVTQASEIWYGKEIMRTRCLTLQQPLTINTLINAGLVDRQIQNHDWTFAVSTINSSSPQWQRPTRTVITVTIPNESLRSAMQQALSPQGISNTGLVFNAPMQSDMTDTLAIINRSTGCLQ
ncbi:hypothetical protein FJQ87_18600 (plasmid) [Shewanella sp. SNU WT4]|uniref:hypothetical protein n=1 Tax=Shewanella sp. SNU WT4 TaxID=2590015 RepID=UPI00112A11B4|nr:hypothetical protein [Shewanella sp. SNU WT4]QDF68715.1 hypothetical protein FJQ87_18600 [Shewanella sp. SNU WT4]